MADRVAWRIRFERASRAPLRQARRDVERMLDRLLRNAARELPGSKSGIAWHRHGMRTCSGCGSGFVETYVGQWTGGRADAPAIEWWFSTHPVCGLCVAREERRRDPSQVAA